MTHKIVKFGDLHYHQMSRTAIGNTIAPVYALVHYGIHEETCLLPKYNNNIIQYQRFVENILVLMNLTHDRDQQHLAFEWCLKFFPYAKQTFFLKFSLSEKGFFKMRKIYSQLPEKLKKEHLSASEDAG